MKKIIVPVDFSSYSLNALGVAADMARKANAEIHLLHVLDIPIDEEHVSDFLNSEKGLKSRQIINQQFLELLNLKSLKGLVLKDVVHYGETLKGIDEYAQKEKADIIVMGSRGHNKIKDYLFGSNTEKLIKNSAFPILVVQDCLPDFSVQTAVFCSNFLGESMLPFKRAKSLLELYKPELHLLKVITRQNFESTSYSKQLMADFAKFNHLSGFFCAIINADTVEIGIAEYCNTTSPELLIMETHGRTGFDYFVKGSIAEEVLRKGKQAILIVKIEEDLG